MVRKHTNLKDLINLWNKLDYRKEMRHTVASVSHSIMSRSTETLQPVDGTVRLQYDQQSACRDP